MKGQLVFGSRYRITFSYDNLLTGKEKYSQCFDLNSTLQRDEEISSLSLQDYRNGVGEVLSKWRISFHKNPG